MSTTPLALQAIGDALANVQGVQVVSAYVFGSHTDGRAHRDSDIDVGVLLQHESHRTRRSRFEARLALAGALGQALATGRVDLVVLNDAPPHLVRRVMTEGQRVFLADAAADHSARRTAMLRAADLEPFLRRMRRIKLDAIAR